MDAAMAERLALSVDPKGLSSLSNRGNDPAVAKAVAEQFGAFLMQGLLQQADGSALPMVDGVGGGTVSAMFASEMGRLAMSGDKLGLADVLLRSMTAKQSATPATSGGGTAPASTPAAPATPAPAAAPAAAPVTAGFPLAPYWQQNGRRPLGSGTGGSAAPHTGAPAVTSAPLRLAPVPAPAGTAVPAPTTPTMPPTSDLAAPPMGAPPSSGAAAAAQDAAGGRGAPSRAEIATFVNQLASSLPAAAQQLGVAPRVLLAQAALETGWGRSVVGNNVFGVKAGAAWSGSVVQAKTHEMEHGRTVARDSTFRSYPSVAAAVQDYVSLIAQNGRYQGAAGAGNDVAAYARGLAAGGYASDSNYAAKLAAVAASPTFAVALAALPAPAAATRLAAAQE